jgi:hypothetical protein
LSTRYQFQERYTAEEKGSSAAIGQYRVGMRQIVTASEETRQGGPRTMRSTIKSVFLERPAVVDAGGIVSAAIRRYEKFDQSSMPPDTRKPKGPRPLEGMTLWYQRQSGDPVILSLTEGRGLREKEFRYAVHYDIFFPNLLALLPTRAIRIGDTWAVSSTGVGNIVGQAIAHGNPLKGKLENVTKTADRPDYEAIMSISGRVTVPSGETAVNAELVFTFPPPRPSADPAATKDDADEGTMIASGGITELRMATVKTEAQPENVRLRHIIKREIVLNRQLSSPAALLPIPSPLPTPSETNSWLTYEDPQGRYTFRHPQDFAIVSDVDGNLVELQRFRGASSEPDQFNLEIRPKTGDAAADRENRDPTVMTNQVKADWTQDKLDIRLGPAAWQPDTDWGPSKLKVYRLNAALTDRPPGKRPVRLNADVYLVLTTRDDCFLVQATTALDPPGPFRKQVEALIKTVQFGSPAPRR